MKKLKNDIINKPRYKTEQAGSMQNINILL